VGPHYGRRHTRPPVSPAPCLGRGPTRGVQHSAVQGCAVCVVQYCTVYIVQYGRVQCSLTSSVLGRGPHVSGAVPSGCSPVQYGYGAVQ